MGKVIRCFLVAFLIILGTQGQLYATLTDYANSSEHVIWDSFSERYWYYGLDDLNEMTFAEQEAAVSLLNLSSYFGLSDWQIATNGEVDALFQNSAEDLYYSFQAIWGYGDPYSSASGWDARYGSPQPNDTHYIANASRSSSGTSSKIYGSITIPDSLRDRDYAVLVSAGSSHANSVPEPSTIVLMGLGLVGLAGFGRKKVKKQV